MSSLMLAGAFISIRKTSISFSKGMAGESKIAHGRRDSTPPLRVSNPFIAVHHIVGLLLWNPINRAMLPATCTQATRPSSTPYPRTRISFRLLAMWPARDGDVIVVLRGLAWELESPSGVVSISA